MPVPDVAGSLSILACCNTYSSERKTVATPDMDEAAYYYYGTSNDAALTLYWKWNETGAKLGDQTLTFSAGPTNSVAAEFTAA